MKISKEQALNSSRNIVHHLECVQYFVNTNQSVIRNHLYLHALNEKSHYKEFFPNYIKPQIKPLVQQHHIRILWIESLL